MHIATISSKRQITIPKKMLDNLALKPKSKVIIVKEKNTFLLKPLRGNSIVEELGGSLKKYTDPSKLGRSVSEIEEKVGELKARHVASEGLK
mgnify:CR=1 FL=1